MSRWGRWSEDRAATVYTGTVLAGFVAAVLGPSLIGMRALLSVNTLTGYFPWRADGLQTIGHERCTGDTIDTVMPSIAFLRNQWLHGHLGAWQGFIGGGSPLGALPNIGLLDPLSLPYFVLPLWMAPAFVKLLELVVAGGGTYLFLRRLGVSRPGGMLAGLVFGTSGFMVVWTNWPQTRTAALIPPLFWVVERLVQRLRLVDVVLVAVVLASLILGGFPAVTAWALEAAAAYFLMRLAFRYRDNVTDALRGVAFGVLGVGTGALLAMAELLPFIQVYSATDTEIRSGYGLVPLDTARLITLVSPGSYGLCVAGEPKYDGSSPIENVAYIGAAALVLAVVGACVRRRRSGPGAPDDVATPMRSGGAVPVFFALVTAAIVLIGWTSSRVLRELQPLPPFKGNPVGRIRSVLGFTLAVLAGFGFDAVIRSRPAGRESTGRGSGPRLRPSTGWLWPGAVVSLVVILGVGVLLKVRANGVRLGIWAVVKPTLYVPALLILATLLVLGLAAYRTSWTRWVAIVALPLLVAGQGGYFFHRVLPGDDPDNFYPRTTVHRFLASQLGHDRYDATGMVMYPSTSLYYGLRAATGHTSQPQEWLDVLRAANPAVSLSPTFTAFSAAMTPDLVGSSKVLDRLGIKYWVFGPDVIAGNLEPAAATTGQIVVPNGATVSCSVPGGPLRGVAVSFAGGLHVKNAATPATVTAVASNGAHIVRSARAVVGDLGPGSTLEVAVPGEDFAAGGTTVQIGVTGATGAVTLQASGGGASCAPIRPAQDHLRLVYAAAGAVVYQRLDAMSRIRWTANAQVITDPAAQLAALTAGVPTNTVVLPAAAGTPSGRGADVSVRRDSGGRVEAHVVAAGAGYLTVADAMTVPGWSVTVDGKRAALLVGDHALGTVAVPAGSHDVVFRYSAPGFHTGLALSGLGLAGVVAMIVIDRRRRRPEPPES